MFCQSWRFTTAELFLAIQTLIFQMADRRPVKTQNYISGYVQGLARKIDSGILSTSPLILYGVKNSIYGLDCRPQSSLRRSVSKGQHIRNLKMHLSIDILSKFEIVRST